MKKSLLVFSIFLFVFFCTQKTQAEIIEILQMEEILPYIDKDTLVVFDIDDTLLAPNQMLGSDPWFRHYMNQQMEKNFTFEETLAKILPDYMKIMLNSDVRPIETTTSSLIHKLQAKGIIVIGLTTRNPELAYRTIEQLRSIDISFNKNPIRNKRLDTITDFGMAYIEGILFTQIKHKGEALKELCDRVGYVPKKVIFINDKEKYVRQLEETFSALNIPYYGFRYGASDERIESFDPDIAQIQFDYLNKLLSDDDAKSVLYSINREIKEPKHAT